MISRYHYLDPFDDYDLIEAYSGIGFEILDEVPETDVVLVACGGGGLLSGVAAGIRSANGKKNNTKVYGVEPVTSNVMYRSFEEHYPVTLPGVKSLAAGLCSPALVDGILLVDDLEIVEAIKFLYFQMATVVEPAGAAPLAALMFGKVPLQDLEGKNIVVVISGRNVTAEDLERILNK
uniref:L-serine deaminase n=1 Tax=Romanomermis culicivorax TaxID=13658 RepID=A0A915HVC2_ROMCU